MVTAPVFVMRQGRREFCTAHDVEDCAPCLEVERAQATERRAAYERQDRLRGVNHWMGAAHSGDGGRGTGSDLGGLPKLKFARYGNADWLERTLPVVVNGIRDWKWETPCAVFAPTRAGKTSGIVARVHSMYNALFDAAEKGPVTVPGCLLYCTGYDFGEAAKRRRLGDPPHEMVQIASGVPMLVLDEVHALHTPLAELFAVLDLRARKELPTFIGTGMTKSEFGTWVGAAALARVMAGTNIDGFKGKK
ncbi:MAG: hypothetical protein QM756_11045 [Polyangiaceae bacterium]